jgi:hypothetical protein
MRSQVHDIQKVEDVECIQPFLINTDKTSHSGSRQSVQVTQISNQSPDPSELILVQSLALSPFAASNRSSPT